ncbi:MAG: Gfo/Idh/MocA family oxidoreductase [Planctomycetes bacterium]|nr:Gfo/Idh/MocA family oxidoreductase [Planctomycetota bacterium]
MSMNTIRIGIVGLGANTRLRHVPGLRACEDVEIVGVCNRQAESTAAAAREFDIPQTYERWEDLVDDENIDAVMIGTWPYLHCPITLAALEAGKHVLVEARMAMNAAEAREMLAASEAHADLVTQIVPSPFGLRAGTVLKEMLDDGYIGDLREVLLCGANDSLATSDAPLHWRQVAEYSGEAARSVGWALPTKHEERSTKSEIPNPKQILRTEIPMLKTAELVPFGPLF